MANSRPWWGLPIGLLRSVPCFELVCDLLLFRRKILAKAIDPDTLNVAGSIWSGYYLWSVHCFYHINISFVAYIYIIGIMPCLLCKNLHLKPDHRPGPGPGTGTKTHGYETTSTSAIARARTEKARTRHEIIRKSRNRTAKPKKRQGAR